MIRTQVSFHPEEYHLLKYEAKKEGISIAEFLRRVVRTWFPVNKEKKWMRYAGMVNTGNPLSSQQIDEIVYGDKK